MKKLVILMSPEGKTEKQFKKEVSKQLHKKGFLKNETEVIFMPTYKPKKKAK